MIPEALDVEDDDRPVNGSSAMHVAHLPETSAGMVQGLPADDDRNLLRPSRFSRQGKLAWLARQASTTFTYPDKGKHRFNYVYELRHAPGHLWRAAGGAHYRPVAESALVQASVM